MIKLSQPSQPSQLTKPTKLTRFEDIIAWQEARQLTQLIYNITRDYNFRRDFSLRDQMQRACVSTMSNIAEGFSRQSNPEFIRFLSYATASATELQSHLYVALDQGYIDQGAFAELYSQATKVSKLINAFMTYLRSHQRSKGASK